MIIVGRIKIYTEKKNTKRNNKKEVDMHFINTGK
jgi:hypothetical protein